MFLVNCTISIKELAFQLKCLKLLLLIMDSPNDESVLEYFKEMYGCVYLTKEKSSTDRKIMEKV